jgi:RNA polymerase subunit RPABC4/transcription elongation factor Spt4
MFNRIRFAFVAALVALSVTFALSVSADEAKGGAEKKSDCGYCAALHHVTTAMRCEKCTGQEKACEHCAGMVKKVMDTAGCKKCMEKHEAACGDCSALMPKDAGHCKFCGDKKMVADHVYCCTKCKDAKKDDCAKCKEVRDAVMHVKCATCDAKK